MNSEGGKLLQMYLMCSFAYYQMDYSLIPDTQYDKICKLLLGLWDTFEHQHKHLISKEDLEAGTAFSLTHNDYPMMVRHAAIMRIEEMEKKVK